MAVTETVVGLVVGVLEVSGVDLEVRSGLRPVLLRHGLS